MKALKYKLAAAKASHAALTSPTQMPDTKAYTRAVEFIAEYGATLLGNSNVNDAKRKTQNEIIARHEAVMEYRKEKARRAQVIADIQLELYAAATRSDLE